MLQVIFGDDEHTAVDGPYSRLLKTRKWLYLTSAIGALLSHGFFDTSALRDLVKIVDVPAHFLGATLIAGLLYLAFQYFLLAMQLCCVYDIVLHERFKFRREDELAAARTRISEADKKVRSITKAVSEHPNMIALHKQSENLDNEEKLVRFGMSAEALAAAYEEDGTRNSSGLNRYEVAQLKLETIEIQRNEMSIAISSMMDYLNREHSFREAVDDVRSAEHAYQAISAQNPADRPFYRFVESGIDVIRLLPPAAVAVWALILLIGSMPELATTNPKSEVVKQGSSPAQTAPDISAGPMLNKDAAKRSF